MVFVEHYQIISETGRVANHEALISAIFLSHIKSLQFLDLALAVSFQEPNGDISFFQNEFIGEYYERNKQINLDKYKAYDLSSNYFKGNRKAWLNHDLMSETEGVSVIDSMGRIRETRQYTIPKTTLILIANVAGNLITSDKNKLEIIYMLSNSTDKSRQDIDTLQKDVKFIEAVRQNPHLSPNQLYNQGIISKGTARHVTGSARRFDRMGLFRPDEDNPRTRRVNLDSPVFQVVDDLKFVAEKECMVPSINRLQNLICDAYNTLEKLQL